MKIKPIQWSCEIQSSQLGSIEKHSPFSLPFYKQQFNNLRAPRSYHVLSIVNQLCSAPLSWHATFYREICQRPALRWASLWGSWIGAAYYVGHCLSNTKYRWVPSRSRIASFNQLEHYNLSTYICWGVTRKPWNYHFRAFRVENNGWNGKLSYKRIQRGHQSSSKPLQWPSFPNMWFTPMSHIIIGIMDYAKGENI